MVSYNSHTNYSSSSSKFSSFPRDNKNFDHQITGTKPNKPVPYFHSSLRSVRKVPMPKTNLKKPIAPLPPTPTRIYKVDSTNFKQVVQKLTGDISPTTAARRLQDIAPPPLNITSTPKLLRSLSNVDSTTANAHDTTAYAQPPQQPSYPSPLAAIYRDLLDDNIFDSKPSGGIKEMVMSPLGFNLTPNFSSFLNETLDSSNSSNAISKSSNCKLSDFFGAQSPLGFTLSPASAAWCSLALASPGALSPGETTVL